MNTPTEQDTTTTVYACVDCTQLHANGEMNTTPDCEPWNLTDSDPTVANVSMGMMDSAHDCEDPEACRESYAYSGEGCEHIAFSTSPCGGCGSQMAGERYAFTLWLAPNTD